LGCPLDSLGIVQVPFDNLGALLFEKRAIAARPNQDADRLAGGVQVLDDMAAKLPGGAGDEIEF
jgi:hypothetical protein